MRVPEEFATGSPRPVESENLCRGRSPGWRRAGLGPGIRCAFPPASWIEPAVAWQRTSPFTVAGAAAALTAFPS